MPKIISEYERKRTKEAIIRHTKQLIIEKKGIRDITVDDIIRSVGLGKSSFYSYFKSKEECIYQVLENALADAIRQFECIKSEQLSTKDKIIKFVREVYLAPDRVDYYFNTSDVEALFRKLPPEYSAKEQEIIGSGLISEIMELGNLSRVQAETFYTLLECVEFVSTHKSISEQAREKSLNILILSLADYIDQCGNEASE